MTEHELKTWKAQCHDQAEQLVELADMLKELEWAGGMWADEICVTCGRLKLHDHTADCELNKLLEPYR